jgi:hypothetical protein
VFTSSTLKLLEDFSLIEAAQKFAEVGNETNGLYKTTVSSGWGLGGRV